MGGWGGPREGGGWFGGFVYPCGDTSGLPRLLSSMNYNCLWALFVDEEACLSLTPGFASGCSELKAALLDKPGVHLTCGCLQGVAVLSQ